MSYSSANIVDCATLFVAVVGALTAIWSVIWKDKEKLDLHIYWEWFGPFEPDPELPFLIINNRSNINITISEINYYTGVIFKTRQKYTALYMQDPSDVSFPYLIASGEERKLLLNHYDALKIYNEINRKSRFFKRSNFWVGVKTIRNKKVFCRALEALAYKDRPHWFTVKDEE